jgi:hypothetical protein
MIEDFDEIIETRDHSIDSQVDMIIRSFPFDEVEKIFDYMEFKYVSGLYDEYQPKIEDLVFLAESLLRDAGKNGKKKKMNMTVSSGRFEAFWNNENEALSLKFVPFENEIMFNEEDETIYAV